MHGLRLFRLPVLQEAAGVTKKALNSSLVSAAARERDQGDPDARAADDVLRSIKTCKNDRSVSARHPPSSLTGDSWCHVRSTVQMHGAVQSSEYKLYSRRKKRIHRIHIYSSDERRHRVPAHTRDSQDRLHPA